MADELAYDINAQAMELLDHMEVILGAGLEGKNRTEVQKEVRVHSAHEMDYWQVGKRQKKQRLYKKQDCEIILRNRQVENELHVLERYENDKRKIHLISKTFFSCYVGF